MAKKTPKVTPKVTANTVEKVFHLTQYPKMQQRYFIKLDADGNATDGLTEVFKINSKQQAKEGAPLFKVITSSGNTHVFSTEVTEVIRLTAAERAREIAELKRQFKSGEIDHEKYAEKITALI